MPLKHYTERSGLPWEMYVLYPCIPCNVCKKVVVGRKSVYFIGRLTDIPDFKFHNCLHPPESEKEAHKFKLGNFCYERVDTFCYIEDILSAGGWAEASSITRIKTGWKKFRELPILLHRECFHVE